MTTELRFVRDVSGAVSDNLPLSDDTRQLYLLDNAPESVQLPSDYPSYVVIFKAVSNDPNDLAANQVDINIRKPPLPEPNYSGSFQGDKSLLIPGGALITVKGRRAEIDTTIILHMSLYGTQEVIKGYSAQQVTPELLGIVVTPTPVSTPKGINVQMQAIGQYSDSTEMDITDTVDWMTTDSEIAVVEDVTGKLLSKEIGSVTIKAFVGAIQSNGVPVTITEPIVVSLTISPIDPTIPLGGDVQFNATANYSDGSSNPITPTEWISSHDEIVIIDDQGLATGVDYGQSGITARYQRPGDFVNIVSDSSTVLVVNEELLAITIEPNPSVDTPIGDSMSFKANGIYTGGIIRDITYGVVWESSNENIGTITRGGVFSSIYPGTTKVKASVLPIVSNEVDVNVIGAAIKSITIYPASCSLNIGDTAQFFAIATYTDNTTAQITPNQWDTSDNSKIKISNSGVATGIEVGQSIISAKYLENNNIIDSNISVAIVSNGSLGEIGWFLDSIDRNGWIYLNGRPFSRTAYQRLYNYFMPYGITSMYGAAGGEIISGTYDQPNEVRIKNLYNRYLLTKNHDEVVGSLSGHFAITEVSFDFNEVVISCESNASDFDPTNGYIRKFFSKQGYGVPLSYSANKDEEWYIIFIINNNFIIPPGVPNVLTKIFVYLDSNDTAEAIATKIAIAIENTGAYLADPRGFNARVWDDGALQDAYRGSRYGRNDVSNGNYVGTFQQQVIGRHAHWIDNMKVRFYTAPGGIGGPPKLSSIATSTFETIPFDGQTSDQDGWDDDGKSLNRIGDENIVKNYCYAVKIRY